MYFQGCDAIAPDFSGETWCYLEGGSAAAGCDGATAASGDVVNNQHYWAKCTPKKSDLTRVAENATGMDVSAMCSGFDGDKALCTEKSEAIQSNCSDCFSDPTLPKCANNNQDISWNEGLSGKLGSTASCAVLGQYFTNARA